MKEYEYRDENGNPIDYYTIVNDATQMLKEIEEKDKEIKKLNNIIASLSIWLNNQYSLYLNDIDDIADTYDRVKNKLDELKELKGSDKDE